MGRGNVCVHEKYEGLYYVDYDNLDEYCRCTDTVWGEYEYKLQRNLSYEELACGDWTLDEYVSRDNLDDLKYGFKEKFKALFPSFETSDEWLGGDCKAILENKLFYIAVEDNEWSIAFELLQKDDPYDNHLEGLQKKHYRRYLDAMKKVLLELVPEIYGYGGAWLRGKCYKATDLSQSA